jgi:hypothetical protein
MYDTFMESLAEAIGLFTAAMIRKALREGAANLPI